jgi:energy-coupling factor transport system permease protein
LVAHDLNVSDFLGHIIELRGYHSGSKIKFTGLPLHAIDFVSIGLMLVGLVAYAAYALKLL